MTDWRWVYEDFARKQSLRITLAETGSFRGFVIEDRNRLAEKRASMLARGITEIPTDVIERVEREWCEAPVAWARGRLAELAPRRDALDEEIRAAAFDVDASDGHVRKAAVERLAGLHARAAEVAGQMNAATDAIARGPRKVMTSEELGERAEVKMSPADKRAAMDAAAMQRSG